MTTKGRTFDDVGPESVGELVPALYAASAKEAERYRQLLEDHGVPASVDEDYEAPLGRGKKRVPAGLPVLVPESLLEDAKGYIADMEEMNELVGEESLDEDEEELLGESDLDFSEDREDS